MQAKEINNHADWVTRLFLLLTPITAVILTTWYVMTTPFQPQIWIMGAFFYAMTASGITGGYHRLFAHRTYDASKFVKWYYALFGGAAFQHSILKWSTDHRLHHRYVDTDLDPYSINKGFWFAHIGWMLEKQIYPKGAEAFSRDLQKDPIVVFQHKYYMPIAIGMCFFLPMGLGYLMGSALGGLAVAGFLRLVLVHHFTFFINSWCHMFGRKPYTAEHTAKDSFLMALFTFGEGYHNYHHTFANDYRNGIRWYHWDPTKWTIRTWAALGLATNLRTTPDQEILAARLKMAEFEIREKWSHRWEITLEEKMNHMKEKVAAAQLKWIELKKEYRTLRKSYSDDCRARMEVLREELKLARREFKHSWAMWKEYHSHLLVTAPAAA
jgi:stearoyl-CoA desaturase (Delta-9 desaturase)